MSKRKTLGFGLGLRSEYYQQILEQRPAVDWFEIISENYLVGGGKALYFLDAIGEQYPLVMHGVSLSIGGSHNLDMGYLRQLKQLADRIQPQWVSDHLCWSRGNAHQLHDLLPLILLHFSNLRLLQPPEMLHQNQSFPYSYLYSSDSFIKFVKLT